MTTSHIRFGKKYIRAPYLIEHADFIACHMFSFLERYDILGKAKQGATFLLNAPYSKEEVWDKLPKEVQKQIIDKKLKFYAIDASHIALKTADGYLQCFLPFFREDRIFSQGNKSCVRQILSGYQHF